MRDARAPLPFRRPRPPSVRVLLRRSRRPRAHSCRDHLYAAPLRPLHDANLGTLLRTCDAVGACLTVRRFPWLPEALERGNTLRRPAAGAGCRVPGGRCVRAYGPPPPPRRAFVILR
ncbi:hypothetical protein WKI65_25865 [Streptomyces sp. MS1.AVA.3]|uniref:hypothetical protein n=1 Tax=Streptomyces decoyicus TaxID=249567 RepID=UPI0030BF3261